MRRFTEWIAVVPRLLLGLMFTLSGVLWLRRPDATDYLVGSIEPVIQATDPSGLYDRFLLDVVLQHPGLFVLLVTFGELLSGLAMVTGHRSRLGAVGAIFLAMNYGVTFKNPLFPPSGNFLLALVLVPLLTSWPYRRLSWSWPAKQSDDSILSP